MRCFVLPLLKLFKVLKRMGARFQNVGLGQEDWRFVAPGVAAKSLGVTFNLSGTRIDAQRMLKLASSLAPHNGLSLMRISYSTYPAGKANKVARKEVGERLVFIARNKAANDFLEQAHAQLTSS